MRKSRSRSFSQKDLELFNKDGRNKSDSKYYRNLPHFERLSIDDGIYEGQVYNGSRNGEGRQIYHDSSYEGDWKDDKPSGYGVKQFLVTGDRHEGYYVDGKREGWGMYQWANGDKYVGNWSEGSMNGKGMITWLNGDTYTGDWINGEMSGTGSKTHSIDGFIEGSFFNGQIHGWAVKEYICGDKYSGQYQYDRRHGWGEYFWVDGSSYIGYWKDDLMDGSGVYLQSPSKRDKFIVRQPLWTIVSSDINTYRGSFVKGEKHGGGYAELSNGCIYEGDWVHDYPHGNGRMIYPFDVVYDGHFSNGLRSGYGILQHIHYRQYIGNISNNSGNGHNINVFDEHNTPNPAVDLNDDQINHITQSAIHESIEEAILSSYASFLGYWHNDSPCNHGELRLSNGKVIRGKVDGNCRLIIADANDSQSLD